MIIVLLHICCEESDLRTFQCSEGILCNLYVPIYVSCYVSRLFESFSQVFENLDRIAKELLKEFILSQLE